MKRKHYLLVLVLLTIPFFTAAQDDSNDAANDINKLFESFRSSIDDSFESAKRAAETQFGQFAATIDADFVEARKKIDADYRRHKEAVESVWGDYEPSTQNEWTVYNKLNNVKTSSDMNTGIATIEVIVEADSPEEAFEKLQSSEIQEEVQNAVKEQTSSGGALQDIVPEPKKSATQAAESLPPKTPDNLSKVTGKDGKQRYKASTTIKLIPNVFAERANRYWPLIKKYCKLYDVDPSLVCAVIQQESGFNPRARSHCGAIGLMQLMPQYAGLEVRRLLRNDPNAKKPAEEELYEPETNIKYGVYYLYRLQNGYYKGIDDCHNSFFAICGYNWGPGRILKRNKELHLTAKSETEVYEYLTSSDRVPGETRNYLKRINPRRYQMWAPYTTDKGAPPPPKNCVDI